MKAVKITTTQLSCLLVCSGARFLIRVLGQDSWVLAASSRPCSVPLLAEISRSAAGLGQRQGSDGRNQSCSPHPKGVCSSLRLSPGQCSCRLVLARHSHMGRSAHLSRGAPPASCPSSKCSSPLLLLGVCLPSSASLTPTSDPQNQRANDIIMG